MRRRWGEGGGEDASFKWTDGLQINNVWRQQYLELLGKVRRGDGVLLTTRNFDKGGKSNNGKWENDSKSWMEGEEDGIRGQS